MRFFKSESGVSPVIGVILMVALTVILAAIVGSYVFGHTSNIDKPRIVETRVIQKNATHGELTLIKGPEAGTIKYLNISIGGKPEVSRQNPTAGTVISIPNATSGDDHVIVVAKFDDDKEQVVFEGYI